MHHQDGHKHQSTSLGRSYTGVGLLVCAFLAALALNLFDQPNTAFDDTRRASHIVGVWFLLGVQSLGFALNAIAGRELPCFRPTNLYSDAPAASTYTRSLHPQGHPFLPRLYVAISLGFRAPCWSWRDVPLEETWVHHEDVPSLLQEQRLVNIFYKSPMFWLVMMLPYLVLFWDVASAREHLFHRSHGFVWLDLCLVATLWLYVADAVSKRHAVSRSVVLVLGVLFALVSWRVLAGQILSLFILLVAACAYSKSWCRNSFFPYFVASGVLAGMSARLAAILGHAGLGGGMLLFAVSMWSFSAAATKLGTAGLSWCDGNYLKQLTVGNKFEQGGSLTTLQRMVCALPNGVRILGMVSFLALELAAPLLWWHPRAYSLCFLGFLVLSTLTIRVPLRSIAFRPPAVVDTPE